VKSELISNLLIGIECNVIIGVIIGRCDYLLIWKVIPPRTTHRFRWLGRAHMRRCC